MGLLSGDIGSVLLLRSLSNSRRCDGHSTHYFEAVACLGCGLFDDLCKSAILFGILSFLGLVCSDI